jgi:beta-mannosidase
MKQYLQPRDLHVNSRAWKEHTNTFEKETTPAAIRKHYADPEKLGIQDYILYGQMFQAMMYGRTIEALRFRKNDPRDDCQGALIWMYNDCWGETGWTPIDYYLRRKPSYYWIRNANTPVKAVVRRRERRLVTRVVNDTLTPVDVAVDYGWIRIDGSDRRMKSKKIHLRGNSMIEVGSSAIPGKKEINPREWVHAAYLTGKGAGRAPSIWTLLPHRELAVPEPDITVAVKGKNIRLVSNTYCHGVHFKDNGKPILSDNYFDLLPGAPKTITCLTPKVPRKLTFHAVRSA